MYTSKALWNLRTMNRIPTWHNNLRGFTIILIQANNMREKIRKIWFNSRGVTKMKFAFINYPSKEIAIGHFVNLHITLKSRKSNFKISNFKISKMTETKKMRLNTFKCFKSLLSYLQQQQKTYKHFRGVVDKTKCS